jgi:hypothetical protein
LIRVPIFKEERYRAIPLSGGSAEPYNKSEAPPLNIERHIDGQYLSGDMVPRRENSRAEEARRKQTNARISLENEVDDSSLAYPSNIAGELTPLLGREYNDHSSA